MPLSTALPNVGPGWCLLHKYRGTDSAHSGRWLADRPLPKIAPLESGRHGLGTTEQTGLCQVAYLHADWRAHYLVNKRGPHAKALLGFRKLDWRRGSHQHPNVLTTQDSTDRPVQIGAMRVIELIIDGFKSYAVRTVVSGWSASPSLRPHGQQLDRNAAD